MALGTVVNEGIANGRLLPLGRFQSSQSSIYNSGWISSSWNYISRTFHEVECRALSGLGVGRSGASHFAVEQVVLLSNVEEVGKHVESHISRSSNFVDRVYSRRSFEDKFKNSLGQKANLTTVDFDILLKFLKRDRGIISYNQSVVRFRYGEDDVEVTEQDETVASLKTLLQELDAQVNRLSANIERCDTEARQAVAKKNRTRALTLLKSKKIAEEQLTRRSETWFQMKGVYDKISEAVDQVQILKAMENSADTLRHIHKQTGGVERVDMVMDNLQEEISKTDEISDVINQPGQNRVVDDEEVEDELQKLQETQETEALHGQVEGSLERLTELPSPPGTDIATAVPSTEAERGAPSLNKTVSENTARLQQVTLDDRKLPAQ
ncbi:MAG: hypothetical protein M1814_000702 [Vezdaea aestivalis]|nr:MAG: hypothetical protein M1814_000702 [Vezdaea aestivalis]